MVDFTAIEYALNIDQFTTFFGEYLLNFPLLLKFLTAFVICLEIFGPLMALMPFKTGMFRLLAVFLFWGFHLIGLGTTMKLGFFPYISAVAWVAFLPGEFWDNIVYRMPFTFPIVNLGDQFKKFVLKHRSVFERWPAVKSPPSMRTSLAHSSQILAALFFIYITMWNIRTLDYNRFEKYFPSSLNGIAYFYHVDQYWPMFAPSPLTDDGWFVIEANLKNGKKVDLFQDGGPVSWDKPQSVSSTYKNQRWRKYLMNIWLLRYERFRLYYGQYLTRSWNASHFGGEALESFRIYFMREDTVLGNRTPKVTKVHLWHHLALPVN